MASGKEHEKATAMCSLPFGFLLTFLFDLRTGIFGAASFAIGGFLLSPDLDTNSLAHKHWGIFRYLWKPYKNFFPHRSLFTHGPLIGTIIRISYLVSITICIEMVLYIFGLIEKIASFEEIKNLIYQYPKESISIFLGLEASAWLHLIQDKDPMPSEWQNRWRK